MQQEDEHPNMPKDTTLKRFARGFSAIFVGDRTVAERTPVDTNMPEEKEKSQAPITSNVKVPVMPEDTNEIKAQPQNASETIRIEASEIKALSSQLEQLIDQLQDDNKQSKATQLLQLLHAVQATPTAVTEAMNSELDVKLKATSDQIGYQVSSLVETVSQEVRSFREDTIESMQCQLKAARKSSKQGWQAAMAASFIGVTSLTFSIMSGGGDTGILPEQMQQQLANQREQYQLQLEEQVKTIQDLQSLVNANDQALAAANRTIDDLFAAAEANEDAANQLPGDEGPLNTAITAGPELRPVGTQQTQLDLP